MGVVSRVTCGKSHTSAPCETVPARAPALPGWPSLGQWRPITPNRETGQVMRVVSRVTCRKSHTSASCETLPARAPALPGWPNHGQPRPPFYLRDGFAQRSHNEPAGSWWWGGGNPDWRKRSGPVSPPLGDGATCRRPYRRMMSMIEPGRPKPITYFRDTGKPVVAGPAT